MDKKSLGVTPAVYPSGVVLVTSGTVDGPKNIITLAWAGNCAADPPMAVIAVRPTRLSHKMIVESGEFVINIPNASQVWATDYCGQVSGRREDKFARCGFTAAPSGKVKSPSIKECPINIECVVRNTVRAGTHDVILGEIIAVNADPGALGPDGRIDTAKAGLIAYGHGSYYEIGQHIGDYGFSLEQKAK
ncbi:MAG: flavin reductase family protein [Firmicutes bacterium]|nr:flavin reductase family protein [Bacillota bacterium]